MTVDLPGVVGDHVEPLVRKVAGLAVGVVAGGEQVVLGRGSTGLTEATGGVPDGHSSFQIGSVTKVLTSLLLADATSRGEVALDQRLDTLIPGAATHPSGQAITLEDLATHTSGLPRLPPGLWRSGLRDRHDPYARFTTEDLLTVLQEPPRRPPGRYRYSNLGAGVLGEALARAAGQPLETLLTARVTGPLEMFDTLAGRAAVLVGAEALAGGAPPVPADVAVGHTRRGRPVRDWSLPALGGAGAVRSTAEDLLRMVAAHLDPEASRLRDPIRLGLQPRRKATRALELGLGWHIMQRRDAPPVWFHNGQTGGFASLVAMDLAARCAVVLLANTARSLDRVGFTLLAKLSDTVA